MIPNWSVSCIIRDVKQNGITRRLVERVILVVVVHVGRVLVVLVVINYLVLLISS